MKKYIAHALRISVTWSMTAYVTWNSVANLFASKYCSDVL